MAGLKVVIAHWNLGLKTIGLFDLLYLITLLARKVVERGHKDKRKFFSLNP
jgi:hypothetical protein